MSKRKHKQPETTEFIVPASQLDNSVQFATEARVSRDGRSIKRTNIAYARPKSPSRPTSLPQPRRTNEPSLDFSFANFSAFPTTEEVEQYLDAEPGDKDDEDDAEGNRRFISLVRSKCALPVRCILTDNSGARQRPSCLVAGNRELLRRAAAS